MDKVREWALVNWPYILAFLLPWLVVALGTSKGGIGLSDDSMSYIDCGRHLLDLEGLRHMDGRPFHEWPPLIPVMMALPMAFGVSAEAFWGVLYALMFGALVVTVGKVISAMSGNRVLVICGMLMATFSVVMYKLSTILASEMPFALLVTLSLLSLAGYMGSGRRIIYWLCIVLTSLSCMTRYIGVTLIISGSLAMLLLGREKGLFRRSKDPVIFSVLSSAPTVVFIIRNYALTGTLVGNRYGAQHSIFENLVRVYVDISHWLVPDALPFMFWVPLSVVMLGPILCLNGYGAIEALKRPAENKLFLVLSSFVLTYMAFLLISATGVGFDPLSDRFYSPVLIPLIITTFISIDKALKGRSAIEHPARRKPSACVKRAVAIVLVLAMAGSIASVGEEVLYDLENGAGVYGTEWRRSSLLSDLRDEPYVGEYYSNYPNQVHYFSGIDRVRTTPMKNVQGSCKMVDGLSDFNSSLPEAGDVYIIWMDLKEQDFLYDLDELEQVYDLELVKDYDEGEIYRLSTDRDGGAV